MNVRHRQRAWASAAIVVLCLSTGGCAWLRGGDTIDESYRGSVFLERVPERGSTAMYRPAIKSIEATHPISLNPAVVARLLRGVQVQTKAGASPTSPASRPKAVRLFSDEEIEFLAPLLSTALARATPDQRVGFSVVRPAAQGAGATEGTLYADRPLLHLTLTRVRQGSDEPAGIDLDRRVLSFVPDAARRPDGHADSSGLFGGRERATLAVDYDMLMKLPGAEPAAGPAPASPRANTDETPEPARPASVPSAGPAKPAAEDARVLDELRALKEHVVKKDMENEALKDDLRALRKQLADQEAELNKLKKRKGKKERPDKQP